MNNFKARVAFPLVAVIALFGLTGCQEGNLSEADRLNAYWDNSASIPSSETEVDRLGLNSALIRSDAEIHSAWSVIKEHCEAESKKALAVDRDCGTREYTVDSSSSGDIKYQLKDYFFYKNVFNIGDFQIRVPSGNICLPDERNLPADLMSFAGGKVFFDTNKNSVQDEGEMTVAKLCLSRVPTSTLTPERR